MKRFVHTEAKPARGAAFPGRRQASEPAPRGHLTGIALALGLGLALGLLWVLGEPSPVRADPGTLHVATTGTDSGSNDCTNPISPCRTLQYAMGQAQANDEILVAEGVYTRSGASACATVQVLCVTETITIRGGYTTTDNFAGPPDPDTYPTTLDGEGLWRVVNIPSIITPTLEGLRIANGWASGGAGIYAANGHPVISGCQIYGNVAQGNSGGGISLFSSSFGATLTGNRIYSNTAQDGGGVFGSRDKVVLSGNEIYSNTASDEGGGVYLGSDDATLTGNHILKNAATDDGGGIYFVISDNPTLTGNEVYSNTAGSDGGGIYLNNSPTATLTANDIYSNTAGSDGGGIYLTANSDNATLADNDVYLNTANQTGGGVRFQSSHNATLTNNEFFSNTANTSGGGVYLGGSHTATLSSNTVLSNTASQGGGICLANSGNATLSGNDVLENAAFSGGGVYVSGSPAATLVSNNVYNNTASGGGGVNLSTSDNARLTNNQICSNAAQRGGGVYASGSDEATLTGNAIYSNTATLYGGGVYLSTSPTATLKGNLVSNNEAENDGGGIYLYDDSDNTTLVNNVVVDNRITGSGEGAGIFVWQSEARLLHTTLTRNTGGDGSGVYLLGQPANYGTASLTNTILVSQTVGVYAGTSATATLVATLWGDGEWDNGSDWSGAGAISSTLDYTGHPQFVDPGGGDYHITLGSAARDAGVDAGVTDDVDGDPRLFSAPPDLGADEFSCLVRLNGTPYGTIQDAVDASASPDDVVQVAGTCRGVQTRAANQQMAYISKTLTLRGGYSADFSAWDPQAYPTTLDAQEQGRVVYLTGGVSPTLERLQLTGGATSGDGGAIHATNVHPVISGCRVYRNTAQQYGGGLYLASNGKANLTNNEIFSNTATYGGGAYIRLSDDVALADNQVYNNTAQEYGGGLFLSYSDGATLTGNRFYSNVANFGSGLYLNRSSDALLTNNVVVDNQTDVGSAHGVGIHVEGSEARLLHTTIARNTGGYGSAVYLENSGSYYSTVAFTNTILVSQTIGVFASANTTATLAATLWGSGSWATGNEWSGTGQVSTSTDVYGDPAFFDPDSGDYHITLASAARDAGADAGVPDDIDGESRIFAAPPDLGADEYYCFVRLNDDPTPYASVQAGVDASSSVTDVVKVAGTCRGVQTRAADQQIAYISKTLTLRGGYTLAFTDPPNPDTNPTTLDALEQGRVIYINGDGSITPTVEGLRLTNGSAASGQGGGGIYATSAHPTISGCHVFDNTSPNNPGGGMRIDSSSDTVLMNNRVFDNATNSYGGGIYLSLSANATLAGNWIYGNAANGGAGIYLSSSGNGTLANNVVVDNLLTGSNSGAGIYAANSSTRLLHTTIARNSGGNGQGIYLSGSTHRLTNTILVSHTVGVETAPGATAILSATLWGEGAWANITDAVGSNIVTGTFNWRGDPVFADPESSDYHIGQASAAFDQGLATWVATDIDGDPRSVSTDPDLGADEVAVILALSKKGPAWANEGAPIAYTLRVTNTGVVTSTNAVLTDTLPAGASFVSASDGGSEAGGVVSWPPFDVPPNGGVAVRTLTVSATESITNDDYVATPQSLPGVRGTVVVTTYVNHRPAAEAGIPAPQALHTGTVTLDGSGSSDPDGDALSYLWQQTGGPATVTLVDAEMMTATFDTLPVAGIYIFTLTVTDTYSLANSDTATVSVTNTAPVADAGAPQAIISGVVTLDGSASFDPDGDGITSYLWQQTSGPATVTLVDAETMTATFDTLPVAGIYIFTLTVTDTYGASGADDTTVTVNLPALSISKSGPSQADPGAPITYTLTVANGSAIAASFLVITDALPAGASFVAASDSGVRIGGIVSWTMSSLSGMGQIERTFTVTATETITNADYRVSCAEGVSTVGSVAVVTEIGERKVFLPLVLRNQ